MMELGASWLGWAITICMVLLALSVVLTFIRLVLGPTMPDRVVALDMFATLVVGIIAVDAISTARPETLRAAIVLALITFLGTVAFAKYVEKRGSE